MAGLCGPFLNLFLHDTFSSSGFGEFFGRLVTVTVKKTQRYILAVPTVIWCTLCTVLYSLGASVGMYKILYGIVHDICVIVSDLFKDSCCPVGFVIFEILSCLFGMSGAGRGGGGDVLVLTVGWSHQSIL